MVRFLTHIHTYTLPETSRALELKHTLNYGSLRFDVYERIRKCALSAAELANSPRLSVRCSFQLREYTQNGSYVFIGSKLSISSPSLYNPIERCISLKRPALSFSLLNFTVALLSVELLRAPVVS